MKNGTTSDQDNITTQKSPIVLDAIRGLYGEFVVVTERLATALEGLESLTGQQRKDEELSIARAIRDIGGGCHTVARGIERFHRG